MKIILYMAMSANGMIARKSGAEDFLSHENWGKFVSLAEECGNFIVGRKTYEAVKNWGENYNFDSITGVEKVVVSQSTSTTLGKGYVIARSPKDAVRKLSRKGFAKILVAGGATVNSAFAKEQLLDEIILNVEPVFVGKGIPLFSEEDLNLDAELISVEKSNRLLTLHYRVVK